MEVCDRCKQEAELFCYGDEVFCEPCLDIRTTTELRGMPIEWGATHRGFVFGEFRDLYDRPCSVQESSLAENHALWLGVGGDRMHLSRDAAVTLIEILQTFVETGGLGKYVEVTINE